MAANGELSTHERCEPPADGQPQSGALSRPLAAWLDALELLEDPPQIFLGNADPGIRDGCLDRFTLAAGADADRSLLGGLGGVAQEMPNDTPQLAIILHELGQVVGDVAGGLYPLIVDHGLDSGQALFDERRKQERRGAHAVGAGVVQEIADQLIELPPLDRKLFEVRVLPWRQAVLCIGHYQAGIAQDGIERVADVVADRVEERRLGPACLLRPTDGFLQSLIELDE